MTRNNWKRRTDSSESTISAFMARAKGIDVVVLQKPANIMPKYSNIEKIMLKRGDNTSIDVKTYDYTIIN